MVIFISRERYHDRERGRIVPVSRAGRKLKHPTGGSAFHWGAGSDGSAATTALSCRHCFDIRELGFFFFSLNDLADIGRKRGKE